MESLVQIVIPQHERLSKFLFEFMKQFNCDLGQVKFYFFEFTFLTTFQQIRETGSNVTEFIDELSVEICKT